MIRTLTFGVVAALALSAAEAQEDLSPLARSIQNDLNRLDGQVGRPDSRAAGDRLQLGPGDSRRATRLVTPTRLRSAQDIGRSSDLGAARQDLNTLKTREPNANATPLLERQLDRVSRGTDGSGLYQPSRNPAALYGR